VKPDQDLHMIEYAAIRIVLHPAGIVHLDPLAARLAGDQPTNFEALVYSHETNGTATILLSQVWV
jgi:hypothetical protein